MKLPETMNNAQRIAVMHGEGPMLVLAGPGSGKTFVITTRISYLIEHLGIDPANILVITFTKEAALNMKNRFLQASGCLQPVNFGTFHAVFYQMLKSTGFRQADAILTDSEKKRYMTPILIDYIKNIEKGSYRSDQIDEDSLRCISAISFYKNTGKFKEASKMLDDPYQSGFEEILEKYEKKRQENRRMDFDDILFQCQKMLIEDAEVCKHWQNRFPYLMIDEYQDINPRQYEIIHLLAGERRNLFVVGDDDQSIYGFRGAQPGLMKRFLKDYPDCKQVFLDTNYRSIPEIVDASGRVISENTQRFEKSIKSAQSEKSDSIKGRVKLHDFKDRSSQYEYITQKLKELFLQELNQTAVLFRTNGQMQSFASGLLRNGIPYRMKEKGKCIYDHFISRDLNHYMQFALGDRRRSLFLTIMNKPYRMINREVLEEELVSFHKIREYYQKYIPTDQLARYLMPLSELEDGLRRISCLSPYLAIQYLRRRMGYEGYLRKKAGTDLKKFEEWMEVLDFMGTEAASFDSYEKWKDYQDAFREELKKKTQAKEDQGVSLMTVHASKGLEFDTVWIPDLNEGVYPHGRMPSKETVEEERRLFYVAMTRAKKSLEITFVTGTKVRPRPISRFLNCLKEYYSSSTNSSNSQLSKYSSNASDTRSYSSSSSM